jgi:transcriptional regulator with GAF, ATPase, and Fis domain
MPSPLPPFDALVQLLEAPPDDGVDFDRALCEALKDVFDAQYAAIFDLDQAATTLRFRCAPNLSREILETFRFKLGEGICGAAALTGRTIAVFDARERPEHQSAVDEATGLTTRSLLAAPAIHDGRCLAVIELMNRREGAFGEADKRLARALAALYAARRAGRASPSGKVQPRGRQPLRTSPPTGPDQGPVIVGASVAIQQVLNLVLKIGPTELPVLILGETGTGKELVARRLHVASARRDRPCLTINCAALSESLLESELFGHVQGAFTGAQRDRRGLLEEADGGAIFLDEVGDMIPACQAKLLRALDYGEIIPVGGNDVRRIDVRVIAATNRPLESRMEEGDFRADLYHRLCGIEIHLPALRERHGDVELLADYFLRSLPAEPAGGPVGIDPLALECLTRYPWPGNVRELRRAVESASAMAGGRWIRFEHLPERIRAQQAGMPAYPAAESYALRRGETLSAPAIQPLNAELESILEAMRATAFVGSGRWNLAKAARRLGMPRKTLEYKIRAVYRLRP